MRIQYQIELRFIEILVILDGGRLFYTVGIIQHNADIADPADTCFRTDRRIAVFDLREAECAFLRLVRLPVEVHFLVRTAGHAKTPAPARILIDEHDAVILPFVNRPRGTGGAAGRVDAVFDYSRQLHHEL